MRAVHDNGAALLAATAGVVRCSCDLVLCLNAAEGKVNQLVNRSLAVGSRGAREEDRGGGEFLQWSSVREAVKSLCLFFSRFLSPTEIGA